MRITGWPQPVDEVDVRAMFPMVPSSGLNVALVEIQEVPFRGIRHIEQVASEVPLNFNELEQPSHSLPCLWIQGADPIPLDG